MIPFPKTIRSPERIWQGNVRTIMSMRLLTDIFARRSSR